MENNLSAMIDVFLDLIQAFTKLIKNTNEKIVLESLNYLIKCISYLYSKLSMKPFLPEEHRRVSILSGMKLKSIEEAISEECSPFLKEIVHSNSSMEKHEDEKSFINKPFQSEMCLPVIKLQTGKEEEVNFENVASKFMSSSFNRDVKKILESNNNTYT